MAAKRLRFAQRRKAAGFTQESLATHLGVERSTVNRWERAETEPQPFLRPRLCRALGVPEVELQTLLDDVATTAKRPSEHMTYVLDNPTAADLVTVAYLHERLRELDNSYNQSPSATLLGPAGQVHGQVKYLREKTSSARVRRALCEVEAASATFMGQLIWDASSRHDHRAPQSYFDDAVSAARHVRDPFAEAYAVLRKSYLALYGANDPAEGVALAQQAAEVAGLASPSLTGLSLLHVAEGHAMKGELKACEEALRKAETQFDRVNAEDLAAEYYTVNEFNRLAGSCYLFLGLPGKAEPILRATIAELESKRKSQAIALGNLSLALIRQRKLDEAADAVHRTIDTVELTRGGGGLNLAFAAGRELRQWRGETWVQEIHDRLFALMSTA
ncbi:helix-turn-helix domain-containing protein [Nonomuraea pusilla]|nr:helix-turn-helix transcriptional regulator [Nonomuraea pusilla]